MFSFLYCTLKFVIYKYTHASVKYCQSLTLNTNRSIKLHTNRLFIDATDFYLKGLVQFLYLLIFVNTDTKNYYSKFSVTNKKKL